MSTRLSGIPVSPGVVWGKAVVIQRIYIEPDRQKIDAKQVQREKRRLKRAINRSAEQLKELMRELDDSEHAHFEVLNAHLLMLQDDTFSGKAIQRIEDRLVNAEWAVHDTANGLKKRFAEAKDEYLRARVEDLDFVVRRVLSNLKGVHPDPVIGAEDLQDSIVVAHVLSPGNLAKLVKDGVAGIVLEVGGETSHTSIIARALGIPAIVGVSDATVAIRNGQTVVLDGLRGMVVVSPSPEEIEEYERIRNRYVDFETRLLEEISLPAETKDGFRVALFGNLETIEELDELLSHGAEGLALVRTEFLYLNSDQEPSEEEQFEWYKRILVAMDGKEVTFRTLDIGGEKYPSYWVRPEEDNPALGLRAVRFCLANPDIFRRQLRALLRASVFGNMRIMFPLIMGVSQMRTVKRFLYSVMEELKDEGIRVSDDIKIGAMIEVPSAAMVADILAKEVDFFSIGTNDLIQYTLAIDRTNDHLKDHYHPMHVAILRMLKQITDAAQNLGVEVSLCGEMGGDPIYVPLLIAMGITELGMSARSIPHVKRLVRSITLHESRDLLTRMLELDSFDAIEELLKIEVGDRFPELCYNRF